MYVCMYVCSHRGSYLPLLTFSATCLSPYTLIRLPLLQPLSTYTSSHHQSPNPPHTLSHLATLRTIIHLPPAHTLIHLPLLTPPATYHHTLSHLPLLSHSSTYPSSQPQPPIITPSVTYPSSHTHPPTSPHTPSHLLSS